jgi:hypothetical protein
MSNILQIVLLLIVLNYNQPYRQYYKLPDYTPIWFCIPDELGWTRGNVIYLWGYYPMIQSEYPLKDFNDVVWEVAYE